MSFCIKKISWYLIMGFRIGILHRNINLVCLVMRRSLHMADLVCHCFNYTAQDILKEVEEHGRSLIMERILGEKRSGGCDCANKNPKGR